MLYRFYLGLFLALPLVALPVALRDRWLRFALGALAVTAVAVCGMTYKLAHYFAPVAPLVVLLPGLERWTPAQRRLLVRILRAKGGRSEAEFVRLSNGHARFRRALQKLCLDWDERD